MSIKYFDYTNEDKQALEAACLQSLNTGAKPLGVIYCDLLEGSHVFYKFTEDARHLLAGPQLMCRVQIEKRKVSQALRRLERRGLAELSPLYVHPPNWRLTWTGMDVAAAVD